MNSTRIIHGWRSSPNERGTIDILWSCLFTIFLCTWTALHLNLPAPDEKYSAYLLRKGKWMVLNLLGPEFLVWLALGQLYEAKDSVRMFKEIGHDGWTLRHGFYANMGGIAIQTSDCGPFPVTARQVHYLVWQDYMPFPQIHEKEIWDKSKADMTTKALVCGQICWLLLQVTARLIQHLEITTLELTTLGYVLCALATYLAWLYKPLDIEVPTIIRLETSMERILRAAGPLASKPYKQNPLDFVDNQGPCWWMNVQVHFPFRVEPRQRPLPRFTNDKFPNVGLAAEAGFYFLVAHGFVAIHLAGWRLHSFPTQVEKVLWRVSCLVMAGVMILVWFLEGAAEQVRSGRFNRWHRRLSSAGRSSESSSTSLERQKSREEISADPEFIPMWEFIAFVPVALVYSVARAYLMAETLAGLRALPAGAYKVTDWTKFLPHV